MNHHRTTIGDITLPVGVRIELAWQGLQDRLRSTWDERADETGIDEAVTKMIWLAVGITVAVTAAGFFLTVFNSAKSTVPDPVRP
jgi:N-glycosylase/DNA lyase